MLADPFSPLELARPSAPARELAQGRSGTDEVLLMWYPENERVELSIRDVATGAGVHLDVAPGCALDAFYHPYVSAGRRENSDCVVRRSPRSADG